MKNGKIPDFDYIMLESNFKFKNIFWNNSTAYVKINNEYHWMEHHDWESPNCNLDNWSSPIRIILKKKDLNFEENEKNNDINKDKDFNLNIVFGIKPDLTFDKINNIIKCDLKKFDFAKKNIAEFVDLRISIK
jgi:hypothetical protein